jgi:hypothetical protein
MALGLQQWREHRNDRLAAQEALEAVYEEMGRNADRMEKGVQRCEASQESLKGMVAHVDALLQARRKGAAPPPTPDLPPTGTGWLVTSDAWTALKSMGLLRNLTPATVRTLSSAYGVGEFLDKGLRLHPAMAQPKAGVYKILMAPRSLAGMDSAKLESTRDELLEFKDFFENAGREMASTRQTFLEAREAIKAGGPLRN